MRPILCTALVALVCLNVSADQLTYDRDNEHLGTARIADIVSNVVLFRQISDPVGCLEHWRGNTEVLVSLGDTDGVPDLGKVEARAWLLTQSGCMLASRVFVGNLGEGMYGPGLGFAFADSGEDPLRAVVLEIDGQLYTYALASQQVIAAQEDVCSHCQALCIPIVYGKPGRELVERAERGEVFLAGCAEAAPRWYCPSCKTQQ